MYGSYVLIINNTANDAAHHEIAYKVDRGHLCLSLIHIFLLSHCLRNVLPTIVSIMAISIPHVLSGTYVAESVFNYPGIGLLAVSSAKYHDYNLLMLMVLITGALVMLSSLVAQAVNEVIDPRMKSSDGVVC